MNFYQRHIGDYAKKAGRLSMLEHGAYTNLLDACYDRESFPTEDEAFEWCWAESENDKEAVRRVLRRFFILEDGVYVQPRIREEILKYHAMKDGGAKGAEIRWAKAGHAPPIDPPILPSNQEPIPSNQEPIPKRVLPRATRFGLTSLPPEWQEFCFKTRPDLNHNAVFERFADHWQAKSGKDATKVDWFATWRNWVRNEREKNPTPANKGMDRLQGLMISGRHNEQD